MALVEGLVVGSYEEEMGCDGFILLGEEWGF